MFVRRTVAVDRADALAIQFHQALRRVSSRLHGAAQNGAKMNDPLSRTLLSLNREFGFLLLARDLGVHRIRREIDFSQPSNRSAIDEDLFEEALVA